MPTKPASVAEQDTRLAQVLRLLNQIVKATVSDSRLSSLAPRVAEIIPIVFDLRQELWDIDPDLVEAFLLPKKKVDLSRAVEVMDRGDPMMIPHALGNLLMYAPSSIVSEAASLETEEEKAAFLRRWWKSVAHPFVPIDHLDRTLDAPRRWRRIHAARALAEIGLVDLLGPDGEVDQDALTRWRSSRAR